MVDNVGDAVLGHSVVALTRMLHTDPAIESGKKKLIKISQITSPSSCGLFWKSGHK